MDSLLQGILDSYSGYANHLYQEIFFNGTRSYFWWLIIVSLFFLGLEWIKPWRKDQAKFRKDFWLDFFYMFFNFFLFWLLIYNAASDVVVMFFNDLVLSLTGIDLQSSNPLVSAPLWLILLVGFIVRDFVQWWTHRLLHRVPFLWNFHKVHHSVREMGFAAHLRYHWMETVVYRSIEYIPLALLGLNLHDFFIIHIFTLAVGHYNHSNISISPKWTGLFLCIVIGLSCILGIADISFLVDSSIALKLGFIIGLAFFGYFVLSRAMPYLFNSPEMHIWHHSKTLPDDHQYGVNFGLSLAIWDYAFGTAHIPHSGRDISLGFEGVEDFPKSFMAQASYGITSKK